MPSKSHQGMEEISVRQLLDLKQWQKIQNLFAEIIGTNLCLIEPSGTSLTTIPSKVSNSCSDFAQYRTSPRTSPVDCTVKAFQNWFQQKESAYKCPHGLSYFSLPIWCNEKTIGVIVVGPLLVGKREDDKTYRMICERQNIDPKIFLDRIYEVKVFSPSGIRVMIDFLQELTQYLVRLAYQREELERLLPGFLTVQGRGQEFFSATYLRLLVNCLLDIASHVVHADSGSVLLVDESEKNFFIKLARGIPSEILKKRRMPVSRGVAGWVASQKKPVLIGPYGDSTVPAERLKRPKIKASIVVPLRFQEKILGVFCLNTMSANKRFNQNNLLLLDQLGKLASVALARTSVN